MILNCKNCGSDFNSERASRKYCSRECANEINGKKRSEAEYSGTPTVVWSCGGGIQSVAIAALIYSGTLPKPDIGFMTDCGYERLPTYTYMREVIIPKMKEIDVQFRMIQASDYTEITFFDNKGFCKIPAFKKMSDGSVIKFRTRCNSTWKLDPAIRFMRELGIEKCENWIGISTDESRRARASTRKWITYKYPLIELGLSREHCIYEIAKVGWPLPVRSSCVFCPMQTKESWQTMKDKYPEDWKKAVNVEKFIQARCPDVFLRKDCKPLSDTPYTLTTVIEGASSLSVSSS